MKSAITLLMLGALVVGFQSPVSADVTPVVNHDDIEERPFVNPMQSSSLVSTLTNPEILDSTIQSIMAADHIPGVAALVSQSDQASVSTGQREIFNFETAVDSMWGLNTPGFNQATLLAIWNSFDRHAAVFTEESSNSWDSIYDVYLSGSCDLDTISRGQLCAIAQRWVAVMNDGHCWASDTGIANTPLAPGVPLLKCFPWGNNTHFGAGLTALPDGTALVYDVVPNHPLGLEPGDIILGYDDMLWSEIYPLLYAQEIPLSGLTEPPLHALFQNHALARHHAWTSVAGLNWHFFDSINVLKYNTGLPETYSTGPLIGQSTPIWCTEQISIDGIDRPDVLSDEFVTWGIYPGTDIGYIYYAAMLPPSLDQWEAALDSLLAEYETSGIIIDLRYNLGGWVSQLPTFHQLFDTTFDFADCRDRCNLTDRLSLCEGDCWPNIGIVGGSPGQSYDHPIAVLIGPGAGSLGDQVPIALSYHPMARLFGKPTAGLLSFSGYPSYFNTINGWCIQGGKPVLILTSDPGDPLHDNIFPIDPVFSWVDYEDVWLTPEMVAQGKDDVVEAALAWIDSRDLDDDGILNEIDNCPEIANEDQEDADADGVGDPCDACPGFDDFADYDGDTIADGCDNCPDIFNPTQADRDDNGIGDACQYPCGDASGDEAVNIGDAVAIINYIFKGGPEPDPLCRGDASGDIAVNIGDAVYLISYIFKGGPEPMIPCCP